MTLVWDDFLDITTKERSREEIIDELDSIKIKNFFSAKDNIKRTRRKTTDWEKIFA